MPQEQLVGRAKKNAPDKNGEFRLSTETAYHRYQNLLLDRNSQTVTFKEGGGRKVLSEFDIKLRRVIGTYFLSPFFLLSSLSVMLWFPEDLIRKVMAPLSSIKFWELVGKRVFDILGAIMGFMFCSLFFFIIPVFIKFDSHGPIFYKQRRAGMNNRMRDRRVINLEVANDRRKSERRRVDLFGRPFWVYKFRTMRVDAESGRGAVWAQKNDPRITSVGRILRFTHVDEIPQFFNVLCGEMSLVGPRPERPQLIPQIVEQIPGYPNRLRVKPGMTGIAQIVCGYDVSIESVKEKLRYDMHYVRNNSLKADIAILFQTLWVIIRGKEILDS